MKKLTLVVDAHLRVGKRNLKDAGLTLREVKEAFEVDNPEFWKKSNMGFWTGETPRKLTLVREDGEDLLLPRGGWVVLARLAKRVSAELEPDDRTVQGTGPLPFTYRTPSTWELGPDQRSAAKAMVLRRQGILVGPCASGKTEILLKAISDLGEKTLVLVHTERILRQWVEKAAARFSVPERRIGVLYGREKRDGDLVVGMIRSVLNKVKAEPRWAERWGTLVLDEAHHAPASTFAEVVSSFPARNRLAATATPKRKDGKEPLFYDAFGVEMVRTSKGGIARGPRIVFEIRDEHLDAYGRIVPVDVVVVPTDFDYDLNRERELEGLGFERASRESGTAAVRRWAKETKWFGSLKTYAEMLDEMVRDDKRRARVLEFLLPEVAAGRTCLLLADRREMCLELQSWLKRRGIEAGRLMGGRDAKEQERTAEGLEEGSLRVAVGTTVADEGMDVQRLDRGFGMTPAASNAGRFTQQLGRLKRRHEDKADAVYFYFWDRRVRSLNGHARAIRNVVQAPHRTWFSRKPGERQELTLELIRDLEEVE